MFECDVCGIIIYEDNWKFSMYHPGKIICVECDKDGLGEHRLAGLMLLEEGD